MKIRFSTVLYNARWEKNIERTTKKRYKKNSVFFNKYIYGICNKRIGLNKDAEKNQARDVSKTGVAISLVALKLKKGFRFVEFCTF